MAIKKTRRYIEIFYLDDSSGEKKQVSVIKEFNTDGRFEEVYPLVVQYENGMMGFRFFDADKVGNEKARYARKTNVSPIYYFGDRIDVSNDVVQYRSLKIAVEQAKRLGFKHCCIRCTNGFYIGDDDIGDSKTINEVKAKIIERMDRKINDMISSKSAVDARNILIEKFGGEVADALMAADGTNNLGKRYVDAVLQQANRVAEKKYFEQFMLDETDFFDGLTYWFKKNGRDVSFVQLDEFRPVSDLQLEDNEVVPVRVNAIYDGDECLIYHESVLSNYGCGRTYIDFLTVKSLVSDLGIEHPFLPRLVDKFEHDVLANGTDNINERMMQMCDGYADSGSFKVYTKRSNIMFD